MERRLAETQERKPTVTYGVAFVCVAAGMLIRLPMQPVLQDKVPYITFFLATAVSASYGGMGPGLVTTFFGALLAGLYVVPPVGSLAFGELGDYLGLFIFLAVGGFISYICGKRLDSRRHELALRTLFQQTFDSIGDAVITTDDARRVRLMNPVAEQLTGWKEEEAKGVPIGQVFRIFREGSDEPEAVPIDRILATGEVVSFSSHAELMTKSGQRIPIDDSGAPIRSLRGQVVGAVLVFRDITARRRSEKALVEVNDELKQFTYAATHDIREPLRTISVFAQLLEQRVGGSLDGENAGHLARIHESALRLSHLVDSLLQFAKVRDAGEQFAPSASVDAEGALAEALRNLDLRIAEAHASVTHDTLPPVRGNFVHLCQILQNLVGNAVKYRRPGVSPAIHISASRREDWCVFSVRDNGIGIAPENAAEIFLPFKRLHGPDIRGAGIGLALCKRIVERYGGRIWAEANEGPGTTFYFSLPASTSAAASAKG
jgi:PAS domain S-box-containing protein